MKKSIMEVGGHAPVLVFDDADMEQAVATMVKAKFRNAGQVCISPTRFLVQDAIFDAYLEKFVARTGKIRVATVLRRGADMGPIANGRCISVLRELIEDAAAKTAGSIAATDISAMTVIFLSRPC